MNITFDLNDPIECERIKQLISYCEVMDRNEPEKVKPDSEILVKDLNLSVRFKNHLIAYGIDTCIYLRRLPKSDIRRIPGIGVVAAREIEVALNEILAEVGICQK